MGYSNLRIRAYLRAGVVADEWLPLDGALLYQHTRNDLDRRAATVAGASLLEQPKGAPMKGGRMPIAIVHARDWYYRCSWAQWGPHADGQDHWAKRIDQTLVDLIDFRGRRGKIDTSAAAYKAYHMPVFYRAAAWVEWYCVGDSDQLTPLIGMITHLGKKTSQGWGRVMIWEIEPIAEDWSIWREGKLMRAIPKRDAPDDYHGRMGYYGIRPSYWDRRNQMELVMP